MTVEELIATLDLEPHPEGGHYARMFTHPTELDGRPIASAIYYLLGAGERSHWHRIDAVEIWHHYAGAPLQLSLSTDGVSIHDVVLGADVVRGERPQVVVRERVWLSAVSLGAYTLVGATVSPAFTFAGFELAPPDWTPGP